MNASLDGQVVLLVDDEDLFRMTVAAALTARFPGIVVREAASGAEALVVLAAERVDCVVTDLSMKDVDGVELLSHMLVERSAIPAIVVSAFAAPGPPVPEGLVCLSKPVELYALCSTIAAVALGIFPQRSQITLSGLVQLLGGQPYPCALRLEDEAGGTAELRFDGGVLVGAEARPSAGPDGVLSGIAGALEALSWRATRVIRERRAPSRPPTQIEPVSLENLLAHLHARSRRAAQP